MYYDNEEKETFKRSATERVTAYNPQTIIADLLKLTGLNDPGNFMPNMD